nr:MAG TPA: hypothetical protein [Caudoviricetes sp.]
MDFPIQALYRLPIIKSFQTDFFIINFHADDFAVWSV